MKNLFVSFWCKENGRNSEGNICVPHDVKICNSNDVISLQEYIEMTYGIENVVVNNFRRME